MPHESMTEEELSRARMRAHRVLFAAFADFVDNPSAERWIQLEDSMKVFQHYEKNVDVATKAEKSPDRTVLETRLRQFRRAIAEEQGWPPYRVFTETMLRELLDRQPTTIEELEKITGLGRKKTLLFGGRLLETIAPTEQKPLLPS